MFQLREKNYFLFYAALVYLLFPIVGVVEGDYPFWTFFLTVGFAMSYILSFNLEMIYYKWQLLLWTYMLAYVIFMSIYANIGMAWFFFYGINILVWHFKSPIKSYPTLSYIASLLSVLLFYQIHQNDIFYKTMSLVIAIVMLSMWLFMRRVQIDRQLKDELYQKNQYINLLTAENERNRIGRDLHDTLGHTFAMLTVKTELALKQLEKEKFEQVQQQLRDIQSISKSSMSDVRLLISDISQRSLDDELKTITSMFDLSGIQLTVDNSLFGTDLSTSLEGTISMILRELTTNIIKHARAKKCQLTLKKEQKFVIEVRDDGCGFSNVTGKELHSIRERIEAFKGEIDIVSKAHPTIIRVSLEERDVP